MDLLGEKRVRGAHHGADVRVVLKILNRNVERVAPLIQLLADRLEGPVAVGVHYVATIPLLQKLRIQPGIIRPWALPRPYAVATLIPLRWALTLLS